MSQRFISVILPLFNKGNSIEQTVSSVLNQSFVNFEVIIVDDGSTDGGPEKVSTFNDPRLRLIRQKNSGVSSARNRGIEEAKGEYIAFLDGDDLWEPWFLNEIATLLDNFPQAGIYATSYEFNKNGKYLHPKFRYINKQNNIQIFDDYFKASMGHPPVTSSSVTIPKYVFNSVGMFNVAMKNGEDLDMWARIAFKYPVAWSSRKCAIYNLSAENRSASNLTNTDISLAKHLPQNTLSQKWFKLYIIKLRLNLAEKMLRHKQYLAATRLFFKCLTVRLISGLYMFFLIKAVIIVTVSFFLKFVIRNSSHRNNTETNTGLAQS